MLVAWSPPADLGTLDGVEAAVFDDVTDMERGSTAAPGTVTGTTMTTTVN